MRSKRIQHEIYLQALLRDQELTKQSAELSAKLIDNIIIRSQKKTIKLLLEKEQREKAEYQRNLRRSMYGLNSVSGNGGPFASPLSRTASGISPANLNDKELLSPSSSSASMSNMNLLKRNSTTILTDTTNSNNSLLLVDTNMNGVLPNVLPNKASPILSPEKRIPGGNQTLRDISVSPVTLSVPMSSSVPVDNIVGATNVNKTASNTTNTINKKPLKRSNNNNNNNEREELLSKYSSQNKRNMGESEEEYVIRLRQYHIDVQAKMEIERVNRLKLLEEVSE